MREEMEYIEVEVKVMWVEKLRKDSALLVFDDWQDCAEYEEREIGSEDV